MKSCWVAVTFCLLGFGPEEVRQAERRVRRDGREKGPRALRGLAGAAQVQAQAGHVRLRSQGRRRRFVVPRRDRRRVGMLYTRRRRTSDGRDVRTVLLVARRAFGRDHRLAQGRRVGLVDSAGHRADYRRARRERLGAHRLELFDSGRRERFRRPLRRQAGRRREMLVRQHRRHPGGKIAGLIRIGLVGGCGASCVA